MDFTSDLFFLSQRIITWRFVFVAVGKLIVFCHRRKHCVQLGLVVWRQKFDLFLRLYFIICQNGCFLHRNLTQWTKSLAVCKSAHSGRCATFALPSLKTWRSLSPAYSLARLCQLCDVWHVIEQRRPSSTCTERRCPPLSGVPGGDQQTRSVFWNSYIGCRSSLASSLRLHGSLTKLSLLLSLPMFTLYWNNTLRLVDFVHQTVVCWLSHRPTCSHMLWHW